MDKETYYKYLFIIGGIWNLSLSLPFLILSFIDMNLISLYFGVVYTDVLFWFQSFWISVAFFGIGYIWVGIDINDNHAVVFLATILKIMVFIFFAYYFTIGEFPLIFLLGGTGDLVFSILFIEFLVNYKKKR